jgi:tetratricopeptide (TPR) repeat protein
MIFDMRLKLFFGSLCLALVLFSCGGGKNTSVDLEKDNLRADSLSIKLNSPELKAVNKELINDPNNASLYNKRARVYLQLRYFEDAVNDGKRAIRLDSMQPSFHLTLVDVYYAQNNTRLVSNQLRSSS